MKRKQKKLTLSRETIGILSTEDMMWVQGGNSVGSAISNCDACDKVLKTTKPPL